ncbi:unnamed protein product [Agarophyton chilense]
MALELVNIYEAPRKELNQTNELKSHIVFRLRELWEVTVRFGKSGMSFNLSASVLQVPPQQNGAQSDMDMRVEMSGNGAAIAAAVPSYVSPGPGEVGKPLEEVVFPSCGSTPVMSRVRGQFSASVHGRGIGIRGRGISKTLPLSV